MKAAFIYFVCLVAYLLGTSTQLSAHERTAHLPGHYVVIKQQLEKKTPLDIEEENDEDDISRKVNHFVKKLSAFTYYFLNDVSIFFSGLDATDAYVASTDRDIYIVQRVLRI